MRKAVRLATLAIILASGRWAASSPGDPQIPLRKTEPPIPIFLNAPSDLEVFWKMLARPDLVILDGSLYRALRGPIEAIGLAKEAPPGVVERLDVAGSVSGDWARLRVEFRVAMSTDGPAWVPIRLDGLTPSDVRDASGERPARVVEGRGWEVELQGRGEHLVQVDLVAPVRSTVEGRKLELVTPPAASTRLNLTVPGNVLDASVGPDEPIVPVPAPDGRGVRLSARLSPRPGIRVSWRERSDPAVELPALLSAQGEVALRVEQGSIRSSSSWIIESIRGTTSQLTVRLDAADEVLGVEVDGRPIQVQARREDSVSVLAIPLAEPLRPEATVTLVINTRRATPAGSAVQVAIRGVSFDRARDQRGVVAIARAGPVFLDPTPGRALLRIDPRIKLPESLRARPDMTLAFEFSDLPYELTLAIEPAPPTLRVGSRTTVTVEPKWARIAAHLACRPSQGRPIEVKVDLPAGLEFGAAEPADIVESTQIFSIGPEAGQASATGTDVPRVLTIFLKPQASDSDEFRIDLTGRAAIDPSRPVAIPIFQPRSEPGDLARFAIVAERNVSIELAGEGNAAADFQADPGPAPADWPWPARKPGPEQGLVWLRSDANPATIPLEVAVRPWSIRHESTLAASIDPKVVEVVEDLSVEVAHGVASRLDIALPSGIPARWEIEGVEVAGREPLGADAVNGRRYRIRFARELAGSFRLRVRYRLPFTDSPEPGRPAKVRIEPIRVLEGTSTGRRVVVAADPRFELGSEAIGWDASSVSGPAASTDVGLPPRLAFASIEARPGPVNLLVQAGPRTPLPGVVVSRLWIRTVQRPEGDLATSARFWVEAKEGAMTIGFPPGSRWVKARVGDAELADGNVQPAGTDAYRLRFPDPTTAGPVLVVVDFDVPAASTVGGWPALRVLDGGVIQQTAWEVLIPGSRAGVGTPAGWTDQNDWFWAGGLWKRRPGQTAVELGRWLTGGNPRAQPNEPNDPGEASGLQSYLFGRVGPPIALRFAVVGRTWLLLLCSGPVLAAGLLVLARRPPPRLIACSLLVLGFAAGSAIDPAVILLVAQSSVLGFGLWGAAVAMSWAIDRSGRHPVGSEGALIVVPGSTPSLEMMGPISPRASDDSTEIRSRPLNPSAISTADHIVLVRTPIDVPDEFHPSGLDGS